MKAIDYPPVIINILVLTAWTMMQSLQLLILAVAVGQFFPIGPNEFTPLVFPLYQKDFHPEREVFFYHLFILTAILVQMCAVFILRKRLLSSDWRAGLYKQITIDLFWIILQLLAVFKIIRYGPLRWAQVLFWVALSGAVLCRLFMPEITKAWRRVVDSAPELMRHYWIRLLMDAAVVGFVVSALYIADPSKALAAIIVSGGDPAILKQWGVALGLNEGQAVTRLVSYALIYIISLYVFLRLWSNSISLSAAGVLLAVKWLFFNTAARPVIWQFPVQTPWSFGWDMVGLFLLWAYVRWQRISVLKLAWVVLGICLWHFGKTFWPSGDPVPVDACLRIKDFFGFSAQFIAVFIYSFTLGSAILRIATGFRENADFFILPICFYGLGLWVIPVWQALPSHFYMMTVPLVIVLCFWARRLLDHINPKTGLSFKVVLVLWCFGALMTNTLFTMYPNVFNLGGVKWDAVKTYSQQIQAASHARNP